MPADSNKASSNEGEFELNSWCLYFPSICKVKRSLKIAEVTCFEKALKTRLTHHHSLEANCQSILFLKAKVKRDK